MGGFEDSRRAVARSAVVLLLLSGAGCAAARSTGQVRGIMNARPVIGACYDAPLAPLSMWADGTPTVPRTQTHRAETFHAGTSDVPAGTTLTQPAPTDLLALFTTCEEEATKFLGGAWYDGRVEIGMTFPLANDWAAGVRHYSCEVAEVDQPGHPTAVRRTASLRNALASPGGLAMACFDMRNPPDWAPMVPARCDQPHDAEYVGIVRRQPVPDGTDDESRQRTVQACGPVVDAYLGAISSHFSWGYIGYGDPVWEADQIAARCFVMPMKNTKLTASVKGIGAAAPPTT